MPGQDDINQQLPSDQPVVDHSAQEKAVHAEDNKIRPVDDDYEPDVRKSNHYGEARVIDNANDLLTHVLHLENDPTESPWTFRAMLIGIVMCAFASVLQSIFYFKPQIIYVSVVFLTVITYVLALPFGFIPQPAGNGLIARICHFLNPWAFNSKEHTFAVIMGTAGSTTALATQALAAQRLYYGSNPNRAAAIFLVISSQFLSYGVAGLLRSTLVHPAKMLWPVNIPVNTLLEAFHHGKGETRQRLRYFTNVFSAAFLWELVPSWIAPIFQGVSIPCLINRDSLIVTNLFGGVQNNEGLGILGLCFDWNYIAGMNSPLWYPISTLTNNFIGYLLCICIFTGVYYGNMWDSFKFPFLSQLLFDGSSNSTNFVPYNITSVLNKDNTINDTLVTQQGIPYLTGSYMINLISVNMSITAAIIHLLLWNFDDIKAGWSFLRPSALKKLAYTNTYRFWKTRDQDELERATIMADPEIDPHYKLMIQDGYTEVPHWWYVSVLVVSFVVGMVTIYGIQSTLPWWSFIVSNLIAAVFILFFGAQMGLTGFQIDLQPMIQMLAGYLTPGRPLANMYFSAFGANGIQQGQWLLRDLKLAQLSHLSPKATFTAQMLGTIIGAVFNYIMMVSIVNSQWDALLSISGTNIWSGQNIQGYNTLAIAWSMAKHTFSVGSRYEWATLSYLVGLLAPIPFYLAYKLTGWKWLKAANTSIIIYNTSLLCVGVNSSLLMFFGCGFFSQFYLRRYRPALFVKFNYLISAALDGGTQVMLFVLSFAVLGASGPAHDFPTYALNNGGSSANKNIDFCKYNAASADF